MHDFTRDTWTRDDTDRKRERLRTISHDELERELIACIYMCEPSLRPVRECYKIQRETRAAGSLPTRGLDGPNAIRPHLS
jgi:hypothetical protein